MIFDNLMKMLTPKLSHELSKNAANVKQKIYGISLPDAE